MNKDVLLVERRGANREIAVLTTNRPEHQNRSNYEYYERATEVYEELAADHNLRVMVITGVGDYFATGGQLNASDPVEKERYQNATKTFTAAKKKISVPVIAAVNGDCFAGGMNTLMSADLAITVDTAKFGYPEIKRGGFAALAMVTAMEYIPQKPLLQAFYSGDLFDAQQALKYNLVNEITDAEHFWDTVEKYIEMIISKPAELIRIGKLGYFGMQPLPLNERSEYARNVLKEVLDAQASHQPESDKG